MSVRHPSELDHQRLVRAPIHEEQAGFGLADWRNRQRFLGAPFNVGVFTTNDNGSDRPNFVPNATGCNNAPINANPVTAAGVFFLNKNCFQ